MQQIKFQQLFNFAFGSTLLVIITTTALADEATLKSILALQQAEIALLKKNLDQHKMDFSRLQQEFNEEIAHQKNDLRELRSEFNISKALSPLCVISPVWGRCPTGFAKNANFYACFPNASTLGIQTNNAKDKRAKAEGKTGFHDKCPTGTYHYRHVTLCCK